MDNEQFVDQRDIQREKFRRTMMENIPKAKRNVMLLFPLLIISIGWYFYTDNFLLPLIIGILFLMQLNIIIHGMIINKSENEVDTRQR